MPAVAGDIERCLPLTVVGSRERALEVRAATTFNHDRRLAKVVSSTSDGSSCLVEEDDDGDVEYKWRLTGVSPYRFEHLVTQMRFRVAEGNGQCLYELGIANDGTPRGISLSEYLESVKVLQRMAEVLSLDAVVLQKFMVQDKPVPLWCGEILITRQQAKQQDGRIAFCGASKSGKSTLLSVLLTGLLDNGAGSARQLVCNHKHEICTGKTTSIVTCILSIDNEIGGNSVLCHSTGFGNRSRSFRMIDLGGDVTKRMLFGLMSRHPDFTGICVSVEQPVAEVTRYARVCRAMRLPFFVLVTKVDAVLDFELDAFMLELVAQLSVVGCKSVELGSNDGVDKFHLTGWKMKLAPIFQISSADGTGIELFRYFISSLPSGEIPVTPDCKFEVLIDGAFYVRGVGPVVRGHVARGSVELGQRCNIGPDAHGKFYSVRIQGIHVDGSHVTCVQQNNEATFALSELPETVDLTKKGKLLIPSSVEVCWEFEAHVKVLSQSMSPQLEPILYTGNLRQAVRVIPQLSAELHAIDRESVTRFRFLYHPEVLREGASIILQWSPEGIAVGEVINVFTFS